MKIRNGFVLLAALALGFVVPQRARAQSPFGHQIEIKLPRGANGMQPSLRLVYSPGAGNGIVGVGWQLAGLSSITRVNYGEGINYAGADTYAHSELGVLVKQPDGSYRSRKESFVKLVPSGTCGDGPCLWTAFDPSGTRYLYGSSTDSRLLKAGWGSQPVRTWALTYAMDGFGNYYYIEYRNDVANGRLYPSNIIYTKGTGLTTYRKVEFAYESRDDKEPNYAPGLFEQTVQRLKWISVKSGVTTAAAGALLRKYRLDYGVGAASGRSQLEAVQEYGSNGDDLACKPIPAPATCALPAQTFSYAAEPNRFQGAGWGVFGNGMDYGRHRFADFNGDGRTDELFIGSPNPADVWVGLSNGAGFDPARQWASFGKGTELSRYQFADVNGDGKTDLLYVNADSNSAATISVLLSNGAGFDAPQPWGRIGSGTDLARYRFADLNGDGKTDIIFVGAPVLYPLNSPSPADVWVALSNGAGFGPTQRWANYGYGLRAELGRFQFADFSGDGKADLLYVENDNYLTATITVLVSTGSTFSAPVSWAKFGNGTDVGRYRIADFNADGKSDILFIGGETNSSLSVALSTGKGFTAASVWNNFGNGTLYGRYHFADFNGDGKTDVLWVGESNPGAMLVSLSTGTKFDTYQSWAGVPGFGNGYDYGRYRVGDFNADGSSDLLFIGGDGLMQVAKSMGRDSRLEVIRNGLGGTVTAGYAIAADVPGAIAPLSSGPAPAWSTVPNAAPRFLVTGVTTHDGRLGHYTTQFAYSDARVVPGFIPDRRNAGFASMVVRDAQTGQYTTTFYNQVPGKEGTVSQVDDRTAANLLVKQILHTYEVVVPPDATGVEFVRETQELLRAYELGVFAFTQWTTTTYDDYGNARVKEQYADGLPTVSVTTTYANDTANWILGRVTRMTTTSGTTTLGDMSNGWVGNTLRTKSEWLNTNNSWVTTTMDYDLNGNVTSVTEPDAGDGIDRTTTTEFDPTYRAYPAMVVNALGQPTQKTYEADGQVRSVTDMNEQDVTTTYDTFGRKLTEVGPGSQRSEFEYRWYGDPNRQYNRIVTWVDGSRYQWREEYFDGSGFKYGVTSSGDCPSAWVVVDHEKDAAGRPHRTSQPYCFGDTSVSTTTEYDAAGRVSSITTPDGKVTAYSFTTAYAAITDANSKVTKKYFNARNKTTAVADPAGRTTVFGYDPLGRLTSITAPDNSITRVWYDSLNRRTRLEEPQVAASTYTYDAVGNVRSTTTRGRTTTFAYDALNRVYLKQPQGETPVTYTYDEAAYENGEGRLTTVVDASGTTHMAYSPTGKLKGFSRRIDGKDFSQAFAFDRADRMTQVTYPNGSLAEYRYTDGGGLYTVSLDGVTMVSWGDYDATGKPHFVSYGNGVETAYQYDGMGHLSALSTTKGANVLQDLTYDWYGRPNTSGLNLGSITDNRSSKLCSDGSNTDETQVYSYDDLYRITQADGVWGSKPYAYTVLGNPYTFGGLTTRTLNFTGQQVTSGTGLSNVTYDPATGNMTRKVLDGNDSEYGWTAEGLLAWVRTSGALTAMTYDGQGQRVKKVYTPSTSGMVTTTYIGSMYEKRSYSDGSPERHTIHLFGNGQLVASLTMAGNILTASSSNPNAWRAESAYGGLYDVKSVEGAAAKVLHLARAAAAHPKSGRVLGAVLLLPLAAWLLVAFASALLKRGFSARFSPSLRFACMGLVMTFGATACSGGSGGGVGGGAPDRLLITGDTRSGPPPGTHFYHRNHINSSSVITDSAGSEVSRYVYLPFGELAKQNSCGVDTVTAKFTGKELDEETNLYYYGARYYDPAIGRFLSPDTVLPSLTDAQLLNRYSYVRNNPIVYVDPTGHMPDFIGDVLNAVGNAVDYVASAVNRAADWIAGAARKAGDFIARAADSTWQMLKAFGSNPAALGIFIVALGVAIATGNAPAIVIIIKVVGSTLAAMAAQSIAMAAGVTNPTVLSIIGMAAGMAASGAGLSQFLKAGASYGLAYALGKAEAAIWGDKTAAALAPLNALAATLVVNGLAKTFSSRPAIAQQSLGETPNDGYGSGGDSGRMTKWGSMDATERLFYGVKTVIEMGGAMGIVITAIAGTLAFPVALAVGVVGALGMMAVGYQVMIDTTQPVYNPRLTAGRKRKRNRRRERWAPSAMRPCASAT